MSLLGSISNIFGTKPKAEPDPADLTVEEANQAAKVKDLSKTPPITPLNEQPEGWGERCEVATNDMAVDIKASYETLAKGCDPTQYAGLNPLQRLLSASGHLGGEGLRHVMCKTVVDPTKTYKQYCNDYCTTQCARTRPYAPEEETIDTVLPMWCTKLGNDRGMCPTVNRTYYQPITKRINWTQSCDFADYSADAAVPWAYQDHLKVAGSPRFPSDNCFHYCVAKASEMDVFAADTAARNAENERQVRVAEHCSSKFCWFSPTTPTNIMACHEMGMQELNPVRSVAWGGSGIRFSYVDYLGIDREYTQLDFPGPLPEDPTLNEGETPRDACKRSVKAELDKMAAPPWSLNETMLSSMKLATHNPDYVVPVAAWSGDVAKYANMSNLVCTDFRDLTTCGLGGLSNTPAQKRLSDAKTGDVIQCSKLYMAMVPIRLSCIAMLNTGYEDPITDTWLKAKYRNGATGTWNLWFTLSTDEQDVICGQYKNILQKYGINIEGWPAPLNAILKPILILVVTSLDVTGSLLGVELNTVVRF